MTSSKTIYLDDYLPPPFWVDDIHLDISINETDATVTANIFFRRNAAAAKNEPLQLNGEALKLVSLAIDDKILDERAYELSEECLNIYNVPDKFVLRSTVSIEPDSNTTLSGLYRSKDGYFTQCEAQGFRRITYFPDRPDVMARYTCTIHADKTRLPILLANGNPMSQGDEANGRHWATWQDPFPKPSYLFAMVAAKLDVLEDYYQTLSGKKVRCAVYVEPGKLDQCSHAMVALKKSMRWDEEVFGLEMDLDHYMIVAVGDFNMGAMENKGLNIFNTKYVLARPDTATDTDYQHIDRVVAHEYFHNWTGNRVTCRDWFQLSLKEGLTVFRDQEFGADMHSRAVTRIQEVRTLRAAQFPEDASPMAHPIRPASYIEINNFYTATVYEKGAEVIRMIHTLLGKSGFRKGMDLYFLRHDGQAVTCDDFVAAMQDANQFDLNQFTNWYSQAGTPRLIVRSEYKPEQRQFILHFEQRYPSTSYEQRMEAEGHPVARKPYVIPVLMGLLGQQGNAVDLCLQGETEVSKESKLLVLTENEQSFVFEDLDVEPIPSLLRNFSAPVILEYEYSNEELAHLMAYDHDLFNRWEAGQRFATNILLQGIAAYQKGRLDTVEEWLPISFIDAMRRTLVSAALPEGDAAWAAEAMQLPSETVLAEMMEVADPDAIFATRFKLRQVIAQYLANELLHIKTEFAPAENYVPDSSQIGRRALRNLCMSYLTLNEKPEFLQQVENQFIEANNMTDTMAALNCLANINYPTRQQLLDNFFNKWQHEALVVDKWLNVQATSCLPDTGTRVRELLQHPGFDIKNPNKVYALIRSFCAANPKHFHSLDGSGYHFAADCIIQLDKLNPQVAARVARSFDRWKNYDKVRQDLMREQLQRIRQTEQLSKDVAEIVTKALEVT